MILYKYSSESGIEILNSLRLKVAPPIEFNDPFEFTPRSFNALTRSRLLGMIAEDREHFRPAYINWEKLEGRGKSFETFIQHLRTMPRKDYSTIFKESRKALVESDLKEVAKASEDIVILCLSATCTSVPMWSHYAKDHSGLAIGFDSEDPCFGVGSRLLRLKYRPHRVTLRPLEFTTEDYKLNQQIAMASTKSKDWKHEEEYRFLYPKEGVLQGNDPRLPYSISIWPSTVKSVILGCKVTSEFEAKIQQMLGMKRFSHVELLRAKRHPTKFKLDLVPA